MHSANEFTKELNKQMRAYFPEGERALSYSVKGGKRIRPVLVLMSYEMVSGKEPDPLVWEFAKALEMIHSYSLVHDDLPCMDNDDYRRGEMTVHKAFGEDIAVLTGDGLLTEAFALLLESLKAHPEFLERGVRAGAKLAKYAGYRGMIRGQVLDIANRAKSMDDILDLYEKKTCALIMAGCEMGAILAGGTEEEETLLRDFGFHLGMAFQVKDDLFDAEEDRIEGKVTALNFISKEEAERFVEDYSREALQCLEHFPGNEALKELTISLIGRNF